MDDVAWLLFCVSSLVLSVTPGQETILVMSRSITRGAAAGVAPDAAHPTLRILVLGLAFAGLTFVVKRPVGLAWRWLSAWLRARPGVLAWLHRGSGAVLIVLGLRLALERRA